MKFRSKRVLKAFFPYKLLLIAGAISAVFSAALATAQDTQPPARTPADLYTGETAGSKSDLDYRPLDAILSNTVFVVGRSNREAAGDVDMPSGTRISPVNPERTRYEGNRIFYHLLTDEDMAAMAAFRQDLQAIPGWIDMSRLSKNAQLAYWLNLYNLTLIEAIAKRYPVSDIGRLRNNGLFDEKLLTIRGLPISLNDIQFGVLSHWDDPLVIYGLFQGAVGGPNIRPRAYRNSNVIASLESNARDFVNSLRGVQFWGRDAKISQIYGWNADKFPDGMEYIKAHIMKYADGEVSQGLMQAEEIEIDIYDHHISDLFNGVLGGNSVNTNAAGALGMEATAARGAGDAGSAAASGANIGGAGSDGLALVRRTSNMPDHAIDFVREIVQRNRERATNVTIEDVNSSSERVVDDEDDGGN